MHAVLGRRRPARELGQRLDVRRLREKIEDPSTFKATADKLRQQPPQPKPAEAVSDVLSGSLLDQVLESAGTGGAAAPARKADPLAAYVRAISGPHIIPKPEIPHNFGPHFVPRPDFIPELGRWYCFEYMLQANTPGRRDGRVACWVDGKVIADFPNLRLRDLESLKIDRFSIGLYIGENRLRENRKWYDDVVVATSYIGPRLAPEPR
jgi:hypothetical protein